MKLITKKRLNKTLKRIRYGINNYPPLRNYSMTIKLELYSYIKAIILNKDVVGLERFEGKDDKKPTETVETIKGDCSKCENEDKKFGRCSLYKLDYYLNCINFKPKFLSHCEKCELKATSPFCAFYDGNKACKKENGSGKSVKGRDTPLHKSAPYPETEADLEEIHLKEVNKLKDAGAKFIEEKG